MADNALVTPWEVKGNIDYQKLIKEFGLSPLDDLPKDFNDNVLFRRKVIFAHRDIGRILDAAKNRKPFAMMTGLMPTGKFHIGHIILAEQMRFWQEKGAKLYIAVADIEAYNTRNQGLKESRKIAVEEYITNYIALGIKPKNCDIYFQSSRSDDAKKANAFYRLQDLLARHITFNEFKAVYGDVTPGKMISSLLQAADMLHAQLPEFEGKPLPVLVPVGPDQDPHLRIARDMSQRIKEPKFMQLSSSYHIFMPGLKRGKMSASDPSSFIALTDTPKEVETKIKRYAFSGGRDTIEEHRRLGGDPDIDVSFQYMRYFFEPDDKKLKQVYDDYKSGKMLTGELKQILIEKMTNFLGKHQERMEKAKGMLGKFIAED